MRSNRARAVLGIATLIALLGAGLAAAARSAAPPAMKNGGTVTVALESDPDALDPTLARTFVGRMVFLDMCEKLYDLNAKLQIVPQLAASLPTFSADKKTVTIKIRKGIKFNDGTPLNAAAVKESLDRDKTMKGSARASELSPVSSVSTSGSSTVILHLTDRYSPITSQLADRSGMVMSPKALNTLGDKFATNPVCVGPFMFKDRVAGDHITLVKSPFYYDKKDVHLDSIVWKIITDPAARAANVRAGSVNVGEGLASTDLPSVKSAWQDPSLTSDDKLAVFGKQLETAQAPPSFPTWEQVITSFDTEMEKVTKTGADPAAALKTVQKQADSIGTGS